MSEICRQPFTAIEIDGNGDVYTCCPSFINFNKLGNIWNNSLEEIWYSGFAFELRKRIFNSDYSLCNMDICRQFQPRNSCEFSVENPPLPKYITLAYDKECNLCCITCRDCKHTNTEEQINLYNEKIDSLLLPLLKNAEILALSGAGEAFYSKHSRLLLKKISAYNSKLLFNINTNGILFNEKNCAELGVLGRINEVFVSLPALEEKIYNKIMLGSDLNTVKKNIVWMSKEQHESPNMQRATINAVISKLNYVEIPKLVEFAQDLDIYITLSPYCDWGTNLAKGYKELAVWQKDNEDFSKFVSLLKSDIISYEKCWMNPLFKELRYN